VRARGWIGKHMGAAPFRANWISPLFLVIKANPTNSSEVSFDCKTISLESFFIPIELGKLFREVNQSSKRTGREGRVQVPADENI
jgi:hypothetical protein